MFGLARRASSQKRSSSQLNCSSAGPSRCVGGFSKRQKSGVGATKTPRRSVSLSVRGQAEGARAHHAGVDRVVAYEVGSVGRSCGERTAGPSAEGDRISVTVISPRGAGVVAGPPATERVRDA